GAAPATGAIAGDGALRIWIGAADAATRSDADRLERVELARRGVDPERVVGVSAQRDVLEVDRHRRYCTVRVDEERQRLGGRAPGAAADVDCRAATLGNDDLAGRRRLSRGDGTSARGARVPAPVVEHDATDRRGWAGNIQRAVAVLRLDAGGVEAWRRAGDID